MPLGITMLNIYRMKTACPACQQEFLLPPATCPKCGYPFDGSSGEQARHLNRVRASGPVADPLKGPRLILYAMAFLCAGYNAFNYFYGGGFYLGELGLNMALIAAYAVCAHNLPRNPVLFAAAPLVLFVLINALHFIVDPDQLARGLWLKVVVASGLLIALRMVVVALSAKGELGVE
jgi:hypothetical protein